MFEQAHAYVDGELDELEKLRFEREMKQNPALAAEVEKLQALKSLVQETYGVRPVQGAAQPKPRRRAARAMQVAAVWVLGVAVGGMSGWQLGHESTNASVLSQMFAQQSHVILHIDENDPKKLNALLADAETLAAQGVKVTMVANADAVKLFSVEYSPAPHAITRLAENNHHVQLVVCKRALRNMARLGVHLTPLSPARTDTFALDYIVQGVAHGWKYQKI